MKQSAGHRLVRSGFAIPALVGWTVAAEDILGFVEVHKAADEKVHASVIVIVEPDSAGAPARCGHSSPRSYVLERAIPIVVIKDALRILRYIQIRQAITVVIAYCDTHAISIAGDA